MISDDQLKEWRALCEKATPGEWNLHQSGHYLFVGQYEVERVPKTTQDNAFIAASRTAVPALLDEVERLRTEWCRETERLVSVEEERDALRAENERLQEKVAAFIEAGCGISPDLFSDVCNERDDLFEENRRLKNSKKEET